MQKAQLKSLEDLEKRQQDFLEKIIEEQRKEDARKKKKIANFLWILPNCFLNDSYYIA